jgi:drug/metabolite transporter (DMT)-like permease
LNKITSGHVAAVLLRGLIGRMLGSFFFIAACVHAPLGNVAWIAALPMSVVFDTLVFRQKVTVSQVVFLVIGFLGVGFIVTPSAGDARLIGWGELYAFLSVSCIGFSSVAIKKSTREIPVALSATAIIFVTAVASTAIAFFVDGGLVLPSTEYLPMLGLVTLMVTGGAMLSLYGYSQLSAATATSIITLEAIWALMLGALVYGELPGVLEIVGGGLIGFSALLIALMPPAEISHRKCGA